MLNFIRLVLIDYGQNLVDDLEQFKSRVKNLEIATVDGVASTNGRYEPRNRRSDK